ncbi:MAG: hypothetical protein M3082_13040 [Candidatus Dormibacteraeota bacterium]|nr:hypothetical protein [Candidatus Dormibacteraeota bacterium]
MEIPERLAARVQEAVLLAQDRVIEAVRVYLEARGYTRVEVNLGRRHGIDIEATGPSGRFIAEAVGAYLTQPEDTNHFNSVLGQIVQRMSDAEANYALALPYTDTYRALVGKLPTLAWQRLGLTVLFVSHDRETYRVVEHRPA